MNLLRRRCLTWNYEWPYEAFPDLEKSKEKSYFILLKKIYRGKLKWKLIISFQRNIFLCITLNIIRETFNYVVVKNLWAEILKKVTSALAGMVQWLEHWPCTEGSWFPFPVKDMYLVGVHVGDNHYMCLSHTSFFLSLLLSLSLSFSQD